MAMTYATFFGNFTIVNVFAIKRLGITKNYFHTNLLAVVRCLMDITKRSLETETTNNQKLVYGQSITSPSCLQIMLNMGEPSEKCSFV